MSNTIRTTREVKPVGERYSRLPEGLHRKRHYRCDCSWCLNVNRRKIIERDGRKQITEYVGQSLDYMNKRQ